MCNKSENGIIKPTIINKKKKVMKKLSFVLSFLFSLLLIQSCVKDNLTDPNANQKAPKLPAVESFVMPFQDFSDDRQGGVKDRTVTNWSYAAGNILIWNSLISMNLSVPVMSFIEAFNHEAEYQGDGVWLWAYEVTDDQGDTYQAKLYGELLVNDEIQWDMYVSKVGGFQDMHWYTGVTSTHDLYAHWTVNYDTEDPKPFISIDYVKDNGNGAEAIRYTNIIPENPGNGGYIEFRKGDGAAEDGFNRAYDVYKIEIDNLLEINWDSNNKNGRVKDQERYNDTEWHCWGPNLHDINC